MDSSKNVFVYKKDGTDQSRFEIYGEDDMHLGIEMSQNEFDELLCKSDSKSEFEGF